MGIRPRVSPLWGLMFKRCCLRGAVSELAMNRLPAETPWGPQRCLRKRAAPVNLAARSWSNFSSGVQPPNERSTETPIPRPHAAGNLLAAFRADLPLSIERLSPAAVELMARLLSNRNQRTPRVGLLKSLESDPALRVSPLDPQSGRNAPSSRQPRRPIDSPAGGSATSQSRENRRVALVRTCSDDFILA
jgi:hypothetical protein